ncbi:MAG TPA: flagellar basal-body rod protein FlgG [Chitinispirillaceae bacterium]|nr:flagellar basal-body rod protein FlgG [Chitinispirillaceae bacterium]
MIRSMMTAATGMEAQQLYMDTISNNLSNVNTVGFKRSKIEFQDLMYQVMRQPGVRNFEGGMAPAGIETGLGVKPAATQRIFEQGSLNRTENPMDWAVQGDGFFQITLPDGGTAYTRDGSFKLSGDGTIVNSSGLILYPQISIPEGSSDLQVSSDGIVSVKLPDEEVSIEIGQIELVRFINPSGLSSIGGNLYVMSDASGEPVVTFPGEEGAGLIIQNYTESSNVQIVDEMVNMISAQRAFEIISKSIQVSEEMLQVANNLKR